MTEQQPANLYADFAKQGFFKSLLEHGSFLENYEHSLRGEVLEIKRSKDNLYVEEAWQKRFPPKMNDYGINMLMSILLPMVESKIVAMTDLETVHIEKLSYANIQAVTDLLTQHFRAFEIPSEAVADSIIVPLYGLTVGQFRRSFKGQSLNQFTTNMNVHETRNIEPESNVNQGLLRNLPFGIGRKKKGLQYDV